jgi:hypothetical protein
MESIAASMHYNFKSLKIGALLSLLGFDKL